MIREKTIDKKEYLKARDNFISAICRRKFKGCLFIYDDNFMDQLNNKRMIKE